MQPWKTKTSMDNIISWIPDEGSVLEFGSGWSSTVMAEAKPNAQITAIEDEIGWADRIKGSAPNLMLVVATNPDYYNVPLERKWDVIINDGIYRKEIHDKITADPAKYLNPGGHYIVHDYQDYTHFKMDHIPGTKFYTTDGDPNDMGVVWLPELGVLELDK